MENNPVPVNQKTCNFQFLHMFFPFLYTIFLGSTVGLDYSFSGLVFLYAITLVLFTAIFVFTVTNFFAGLTMICYSSIVFLASFLPLIGLFLAPYGEHSLSSVKTLVSMRPLVVTSLLMLLLLRSIPAITTKQLFLASVAILALVSSLILSDAPLMKRLAYLLNSFLPLFMGLILLLISLQIIEKTPASLNHILRGNYVYFCLIIVCVCIWYGYAIDLTYDIFRPDLSSAYRAEHRGLIDYGDYPASWKDKISGIEIRRFAGAFFDPIQFGYFCAFASFFAINCRRPIFILFGVFFLYALYLSGSKGATSFFLMATFLTIWHRYIRLFYWPIATALIGSFLLVSSLLSSSGKVHLAGLLGGTLSILNSSVKNMLFGYGIGSGGNLSLNESDGSISGDHTWLASGAESGFGVLIFQTGILGVFSFFLLLLYLFHYLNSSTVLSKNSKSACLSLLVSYFACLLLQENLINSSILMMMFLTFTMLLEKKRTT